MRERLVNVDNLTPLPAFDIDWQKKTPYSFGNLGVVIEYLSGDTRTKVSGTGFTITGVMPSAYGYILRTTDAHGEEIDMYLAAMAQPDSLVYVIDQVNPDSGVFDEHKVMLGFGSVDEAVHTYKSVFADGSGEDRLGAITTFTPDNFCAWLTYEGASLQPASAGHGSFADATQELAGVIPPSPKNQPAPRDEAGGVQIDLVDLSKGPKLVTLSSAEGCFDYHMYLYSALDMMVWSNVIDTLCRVLDLATERDSLRIHIASPGGSVFLMGRLISAINRTKAKVYTYAEGCVASAATAIWAAGHERHILPGAFFMQHMSSQLLVGKTTDIQAKSVFSVAYIEVRLRQLIDIGLFTADEVNDMSEKSADIYISGREAIARMGKISNRGL